MLSKRDRIFSIAISSIVLLSLWLLFVIVIVSDFEGRHLRKWLSEKGAKHFVHQLMSTERALYSINDLRSIKLNMLEHAQADCIVFGTSRLRELSLKQLERLNLNCASILNLSLEGVTAKDYEYFSNEIAKNKFVKTVIFDYPSDFFFEPSTSIDNFSWLSYLNSALSKEAIRFSFLWISHWSRASTELSQTVRAFRGIELLTAAENSNQLLVTDAIRQDGSLIKARSLVDQSEIIRRTFEKRWERQVDMMQTNHSSYYKSRELIKDSVKSWIVNNKRAVLLIAPVSMSQLSNKSKINFLLLMDYARAFNVELQKSYNIEIHDQSVNHSCKENEFWDLIHPKASCFEK